MKNLTLLESNYLLYFCTVKNRLVWPKTLKQWAVGYLGADSSYIRVTC